MERRGHAFCRYADDCTIYIRSQAAGERVLAGISQILTERLKLKVNEAKSAVARPRERKFLGGVMPTTVAGPMHFSLPKGFSPWSKPDGWRANLDEKPLTGEPCAGEAHARFGGRGRRAPFPAPISRRLLSDAGCRRPSTSSGRAVTRLHRVPSGAGPLIRLE